MGIKFKNHNKKINIMGNNYNSNANTRRYIIRGLTMSIAIALNTNLLVNILVNNIKSQLILEELTSLDNQQPAHETTLGSGNDRVRELLNRIRNERVGGGHG